MQDVATTRTAVAPQPATVDARAADDDNVCTICYAAQREVVLVPCGHGGFCEVCANRMDGEGRGCPTCREQIALVQRVFP